jgi:hypothetical protein
MTMDNATWNGGFDGIPAFAKKVRVKIIIEVSDLVASGLERDGRRKGRRLNAEAQLLFDAAWAARCGSTGDAALDQSVADAGLVNSAEIAALKAEINRLRVDGRAALADRLALEKARKDIIAGSNEIKAQRAAISELETKAGDARGDALDAQRRALNPGSPEVAASQKGAPRLADDVAADLLPGWQAGEIRKRKAEGQNAPTIGEEMRLPLGIVLAYLAQLAARARK